VQGVGVIEHVTNQDMIQTAENGRGAMSADLNGDGFADLIVTNMGGYDSRSPRATNLKARIDGKIRTIPSHDPNFPTPTNYEPGPVRVFLNQYDGNEWIKIEPIDDSPGALNHFAVGAKVVVNDAHVLVERSGSGGYISNAVGPLLFGLGKEVAKKVTVHWPDRERTVSEVLLPGNSHGLLQIFKGGNRMVWLPVEN
jgi:hypothetical protein